MKRCLIIVTKDGVDSQIEYKGEMITSYTDEEGIFHVSIDEKAYIAIPKENLFIFSVEDEPNE